VDELVPGSWDFMCLSGPDVFYVETSAEYDPGERRIEFRMIQKIYGNLRLYAVSAWYSYRALYTWRTVGPYISGKVVFPVAQMLFFLFLGKLAGITDPLFIVLGHILLLPAANGLAGVSMTISGERDFRTLPYLIASPAPRGPLFLGRSFVHILDGLLSTLAALLLGVIFFRIDLTQSNIVLTFLCILLVSFTSCGLGLVLGSLSLRSRDAWTITSIVSILLYILCGVNFPVDVLPKSLQLISYSIPLTRGIQAARLSMTGADWQTILPLFLGELGIGLLYICFGYLLFIWFEKLSLVDGQIEAM
jgi:ABC-2 type transport system permease protein